MFAVNQKEILGIGNSGVVYKEIWKGIPVAIKRISLNDTTSSEREETALKKMDHENIIKLFHVEEKNEFRYFVLQLCKATMAQLFLKDGDSKKYMGPMPPHVDVLYQLAIGIEYIHGNDLIHRDLKPENALIWVSSENNQVVMKWADFGLCKPVNERGTCSMSTGTKGTINWLAPEILNVLIKAHSSSERESVSRGTIQSDVFTEGLVFGYFLLNGLHLFGPLTDIQANILGNEIINLKKIKPLSARDLIRKMLKVDPKNRIKSSDVAQRLMELKRDKIFTFATDSYPNVEEIEELVKNGMDINFKDEYGFTALLHLASNKIASENCFQLVQCLIKNGADVNCKLIGGWNVLHLLCLHYKKDNLIKIIQILIENKIEINCKTTNESNSLTLLCQNYKKENLIDIIRLLIENEIDVNCRDIFGENALTLLCKYHQEDNVIDIIRLLITKKIEINCKTIEGCNALTLLCRHHKKEKLYDIIQLLIENKIDVNWMDNDGSNALTLLVKNYENNHLIKIVQILIRNGFDVTQETLTFFEEKYHKENRNEILQLLKQNV